MLFSEPQKNDTSQKGLFLSLKKPSLTEAAAGEGGREGLMGSDHWGAWCVLFQVLG